jgi:hypothetical protein
MRKIAFLLVALLAAAGAFGEGVTDRPRLSLTLAFHPLGIFTYTTTDPGTAYLDVDPMIMSSAVFEYRLFDDVGVGGYLELRGYKWYTITAADPLFGQIYGAPGFSAGLMGFWHFLRPPLPLDLFIDAGVGANVYVTSEGVFPGVDLAVDLDLMYLFIPGFSAGLRGSVRASWHDGGPDLAHPGSTLRPFRLGEYDFGPCARISF